MSNFIKDKPPSTNGEHRPSKPIVEPHPGKGNSVKLPVADAKPAPKVEPEKFRKLVIPREDMSDGVELSTELEADEGIEIKKPAKNEWIVLHPDQTFATHLLVTEGESGFEGQYHFVAPQLRSKVASELKPVRIVLYYSLRHERFRIWPVKVNIGLEWYESVQKLLSQDSSFLESNKVRIISDMSKSKYRVRHLPFDSEVAWPDEDLGELLAEAIGEQNFIDSENHPTYLALTEGAEL